MRASRVLQALALACCIAALCSAELPATKRQPFAIVRPVADHTKLELDEAGLRAISEIKGPVAPVVVIGPYRSGKSFTLNQLLGVSCDEGFGVGHSRSTQTKGVWVWGEPVLAVIDGQPVSLLFVDTEGFESTGKADVYDDRIFALSALLSSVLVYNLPESIRESDLEKLSFAVELSKAFYGSSSSLESSSAAAAAEGGGAAAAAGQQGGDTTPTLRPGAMVWLIQRDFLQGKSVGAALAEALAPVPNPHGDPGLTQLNRIRTSLSTLAGNSTALGLPQPHLDRTKLCELGDEALDPGYRTQRDALRELVWAVARPKVVKGKTLNGPGLVDLIRQVVAALNERAIPTAGSLVEYFNRELVQACRELYARRLEAQALPVDEKALAAVGAAARREAGAKFERERFGSDVAELRESLGGAMGKELLARKEANKYASATACEEAEMACEEVLDREARQALPSMGRFRARFDACSARFDTQCVGPAYAHNHERLEKAWGRELARFARDYNERLLNGLVVASLAVILVFRFALRVQLAETAGWVAFVFLQVYPRTFIGEASMYDKPWWGALVRGWEAVVYNPVLDLERWGVPLAAGAFVVLAGRRLWRPALLGWWARRRRLAPGERREAKARQDVPGGVLRGQQLRYRDLNV